MKMEKNFYLSEIDKISLLTLEEERALTTKAASGDKIAQKKLIEANLRFVVKIANSYRNFSVDVEDLITAGNLGLLKAVEKFVPTEKNRFCTYAAFWIRAYIQEEIRTNAIGVKFPASHYEDMKSAKWCFERLDKQVYGKDGETTSLGSLLQDDKYGSPEIDYETTAIKSYVAGLLEELDAKEQMVIRCRYGFNDEKSMSLSEIGLLMGYSKERIRQIEKRAVAKLKDMMCESDKNYMLCDFAA